MSAPTTPTTPTKSKFSTPDSCSPKRKRSSLETVFELITNLDGEEDIDAYRVFVDKLQTVLLESEQLTPTKKAKLGLKVIQASRLSYYKHALGMFDLDHNTDHDHLWEVPDGPEVHLSNDACKLILFLDMYNTDLAQLHS